MGNSTNLQKVQRKNEWGLELSVLITSKILFKFSLDKAFQSKVYE
jgi:hypothetical protein